MIEFESLVPRPVSPVYSSSDEEEEYFSAEDYSPVKPTQQTESEKLEQTELEKELQSLFINDENAIVKKKPLKKNIIIESDEEEEEHVWSLKASPKGLKPLSTPSTPRIKKPIIKLNNKETICLDLYKKYNENVFDNQLPTVEISWNARLVKTAGRTHTKLNDQEYIASIELSSKVIDTLEKLQSTLLHEMCHVAVWVIQHDNKHPHGKLFQEWASKAKEIYPEIPIHTTHTFDIDYPYMYECSNPSCKKTFGRHSKSIQLDTFGCGSCKSPLSLQQ